MKQKDPKNYRASWTLDMLAQELFDAVLDGELDASVLPEIKEFGLELFLHELRFCRPRGWDANPAHGTLLRRCIREYVSGDFQDDCLEAEEAREIKKGVKKCFKMSTKSKTKN